MPRGERWPRRLGGCAGWGLGDHALLLSLFSGPSCPQQQGTNSALSGTHSGTCTSRGTAGLSSRRHCLERDPCLPLLKGHSCLWTEETSWTQMHRRFVCFPGKGGISPGNATCWPSQGRSPPRTAPPHPFPRAKAGMRSTPSRPGHRAERCQLPSLCF